MKDKAYNREHLKLKYCKSCEYVWERGYCLSNRARTVYKYKELSSYKLPREECLQCERKKDAKHNIKREYKRLDTQYC